MEDQKFNKIIADKLNTQAKFEYSEESWFNFRDQYQQHISKKQIQRYTLWMLLPFLLALGGLLFTAFSLNNASAKITLLEEEIGRLKSSVNIETSALNNNMVNNEAINSSQVHKKTIYSDTVYRKVIVYHYDTIFKTIVIQTDYEKPLGSDSEMKSKNDAAGSNSGNDANLKSESKIAREKLPENPLNKNSLPDDQTNAADLSEKKVEATVDKTNQKLHRNDATAVDSMFHTTSKKDSVQTEQVIHNQKNNVSQKSGDLAKPIVKVEEKKEEVKSGFKIPLKLRGYELGLTAGIAHTDQASILGQKGSSFGLKAGVLLNQMLAITGEAQHITLRYQVDDLETFNLPPKSPPNVGDVFQFVEINRVYTEYAFGLKYRFRKGAVLQPYLGLNTIVQMGQKNSYDYIFENEINNEETSVEAIGNKTKTAAGIFAFSPGVNYRLAKHLNCFAEGSYNFKLQAAPRFNSVWQAKFGIMYHFLK